MIEVERLERQELMVKRGRIKYEHMLLCTEEECSLVKLKAASRVTPHVERAREKEDQVQEASVAPLPLPLAVAVGYKRHRGCR